MKNIIIAIVLWFITSLAANAQFMNTNTESSDFGPGSSLRFTYSPAKLVTKYKGESTDQSFNGVGMTYAFFIPISHSFPLYLQDEFGLRWLFSKDEDSYSGYKYTTSTNFLSATVAMSLKYRIILAGGDIAIEPVAGLDLVAYFLGRSKTIYRYADATDTETVDFLYGSGSDIRPLNFNWHAGGKIAFGKFFILATYEASFIGLRNKDGYKTGFNITNISVGFEF